MTSSVVGRPSPIPLVGICRYRTSERSCTKSSVTCPPSRRSASSRSIRSLDIAALHNSSCHEKVFTILNVYGFVDCNLALFGAFLSDDSCIGRHTDQRSDLGASHLVLHAVAFFEPPTVHENMKTWCCCG